MICTVRILYPYLLTSQKSVHRHTCGVSNRPFAESSIIFLFFPSSVSFSLLPNFSNQTIASFVNFFFPSKEFELRAGKELWPNHLADLWSTDMHYFVALGFPHACNATRTQLTTSRTRKNPSHSSNSTAAQTIRGEERGWSLIQTMLERELHITSVPETKC